MRDGDAGDAGLGGTSASSLTLSESVVVTTSGEPMLFSILFTRLAVEFIGIAILFPKELFATAARNSKWLKEFKGSYEAMF